MSEGFIFPQSQQLSGAWGGLTKREFFAAVAMHGITTGIISYQREWTGQMTPDFIGEEAVKIADRTMKMLDRES